MEHPAVKKNQSPVDRFLGLLILGLNGALIIFVVTSDWGNLLSHR